MCFKASQIVCTQHFDPNKSYVSPSAGCCNASPAVFMAGFNPSTSMRISSLSNGPNTSFYPTKTGIGILHDVLMQDVLLIVLLLLSQPVLKLLFKLALHHVRPRKGLVLNKELERVQLQFVLRVLLLLSPLLFGLVNSVALKLLLKPLLKVTFSSRRLLATSASAAAEGGVAALLALARKERDRFWVRLMNKLTMMLVPSVFGLLSSVMVLAILKPLLKPLLKRMLKPVFKHWLRCVWQNSLPPGRGVDVAERRQVNFRKELGKAFDRLSVATVVKVVMGPIKAVVVASIVGQSIKFVFKKVGQ